MDARPRRPATSGRRRALRRRGMSALLLSLTCVLAACANFSGAGTTFTAQPSLTPAEVTPVVPQPADGSTTARSSPSPTTGKTTTSTTKPADPCTPTDPAVVAACLSAPWGLAPLADGSALVGERTTGRILKVATGKKPVLVTTIAGLNSGGGGGLLGVAVSPSYAEDELIYAYVTTKTDNRIIRIAPGDQPKAILTGIPKGTKDNGGAIAFNADGVLYVGTGDAGKTQSATSLGGKLLRIDEFGKPAPGNPKKTSPIFSSGFTQVTGLCVLPTGVMAAVDHRAAADVLLAARSGADYTTLSSGDAIWTWKAADGGAADCATSDGVLANTSLGKQQLAGVSMSSTGIFSGSPRVLLGHTYGRLLTVQTGLKGALWMTTSNKDGHGKPVAADDRVIVLPDGGASGGNGPD
ncbi:Glucose/arabinose dehydrogenase, beta-propeller fold [Nakamurella panacisegetis]|uniref:Glucose/arabinose dehydrogenase, beta-propeller fold n=1 Tax=Nakamurella panacisegetis TaxID=1090615 RepID=A0A1H0HYC1_9ACTN|nr:PQQ-dependent sugar dehydrogenase [Nakamurella panacisegetis]SDO24133.1 Glucose/arabinose dehydrogenase, beta-propeller fold [Nakamurella panacisegetis]